MWVVPESALLDPGFQLFETMRVTRNRRVWHRDRHLARIERSATTLTLRFDRAQVEAGLDDSLSRIAEGQASRLRLSLVHDGSVAFSSEKLLPLPNGRVSLVIEPKPLAAPRPLADHKTTLRVVYDEGVRRARFRGAYDSLFFTADGRIVEGGCSNVFLLLGGRWWAPPLTDGWSPGVTRSLPLEDPAWQAGERTLRLSDVHRARSLIVCNAVHGAVPGRLVIDP